MARVSNYRELVIWNKAYQICLYTIGLCENSKIKTKYYLVDQISRSALSIPSNIAEGFGRGSDREFVRFLGYSVGSLNELQTQCSIAKDLGLIQENDFQGFFRDSEELSKMIMAFILYLKRGKSKPQPTN